MPLGEKNRNQQNGGYSTPSVLSSMSFANSKAELDKSALSFSFWKGFLKIDIAPLKNINDDGVATYDRENSIAIYLKAAKAYILLKEIEAFEANPDEYTNRGVNSGSGLISISNGREFGFENTPCLTIRKVSPTGETEASCAYVFRRNFHFAVRDYNQDSHGFESAFEGYENTELQLFKCLLREYIKSNTSAYAGEQIAKDSYANYIVRNDINAIAKKLGVDFGSRNKAKSNNSFFSNGGNAQQQKDYESTTLDSINQMISDEDDE